ncbi:hypothetical protein Rhe02_53500 [Rhizocola hellebori]|uniref:Phosphatidylserine/phosphatidylglycerophosphate/ cardiolipin synthase family protein n=2 Tax=Rhizocola hellebori TaxID=1392758 RepID=A0A8J3QCP4_9ACTN|nr:hypothetical protein Rhe02_53500 [Rhizocola hellebori]
MSGLSQQQLARRLLVTVAGGSVAFVFATLVSQTYAYSIAASVFVGGVLFISVYLVEVEQRLAQLESGLRDGFTGINEATELFGRLEASKLRTDTMTQLVVHSTKIHAETHRLAFKFAQAEISRLAKTLKELSQGSDVPYEGEDRDWMLGLTANAEISIDAISLTTMDAGIDGGLWMSDLGQRYLQAQLDAVRRKVRIRRIFVTDRSAATDSREFLEKTGFYAIYKMHMNIGIDVRVLDASDAPGTRAHTMFDFIVFDGSISYESTPAAVNTSKTQPIIINTRLIQDEERVNERVQRFEELWSAAQLIDLR